MSDTPGMPSLPRLLGAFALVLTACPPVDPAGDDDDATEPAPTPTPEPGSFEELCAPIDVDLPVFDAHVHTGGDAGAAEREAWAWALLEDMNAHGVERAVVLPPPFRENPLEQQQVLAAQTLWGELTARCPRVDAMISGFDPRDPAAAEGVIAALDDAPFAGVGALEFDDMELDPAGGAMPALYAALAERGLAVQFHARHPTLPADRQDAILTLAEAWPEIPFVWFGFLAPERFEGAPPNIFLVRMPEEALCADCPAPSSRTPRLLLGSDSPPAGYESEGPMERGTLGELADLARERLEGMPPGEAEALAANHDAAFPPR